MCSLGMEWEEKQGKMLVSGNSVPANCLQLHFILLTLLVTLFRVSNTVRPPEVECRDFFRVEHFSCIPEQ